MRQETNAQIWYKMSNIIRLTKFSRSHVFILKRLLCDLINAGKKKFIVSLKKIKDNI